MLETSRERRSGRAIRYCWRDCRRRSYQIGERHADEAENDVRYQSAKYMRAHAFWPSSGMWIVQVVHDGLALLADVEC